MKHKYRPEVDGLRAIAVVSVIIYHAEIFFSKTQFFKGGYLGVDVFFVISGFLITSIILSEYHSYGKFSIKNFYERRARRILPALLLVTLVSIPIGWNVLYPSQLVDFSKSILSTLAFASNFYWDMTLQEYGAESALLKPFLHTWSLAVEEQYYVLYPLILLAIFRYSRKYAIALLSVGLLISLQFAESMTVRDASLSFYLLPSRFWELLAGGLLANFLYLQPQKKDYAFLNRVMPIIGLLMMIYSLLNIGLESNHPGYITLIPVIGTILIIWFANERNLVTKILASKPFVMIGLISYSLYLWHYPIFSFGRIIDSTPTWDDRILWVLLTTIFSILTYFYIEKPFRNKRKIQFKYFVFLIGMAMLVSTIALILLIISTSKLVVDIDFEDEMAKRESWDSYGYDVCNQVLPSDCLVRKTSKRTLLFVGDSMIPDAIRIVAKQYPQYQYVTNWTGGCVPTSLNLRIQNLQFDECNALNKTRFNSQSLEGIDGVVINYISYEEGHFLNIEGTPKLDKYLGYLKSNGIENILIFGSYIRHTPKIHDLYLKYGGNKKNILEELSTFGKDNDHEFRILAQTHGIEFISIREIVCTESSGCPVFIGDSPYSWDNHHWTAEFTDYLSEKMKMKLSNTWLNKSSE